ncbi:hypothetical protein OAK45_05480 [Verrucomicrobia bacterium]|nr:hypothetical protein [Verrucomicrobiota bacterium]
MAKPRHQPRGTAAPRGAGDVKLRLRLPTDGSVDLDKLRAALEAQLQKNRQPVAEEPAVVEPVIVQPEPQPQPEVATKPSAAWAWVKARPFFLTAIASALLSFVTGIVLIVRHNSDVAPGMVGWLFVLGLLVLITSFIYVIKRERKTIAPSDTQATTVWNWVKQHNKIVIGSIGLSAATIVVLGLWIAAFNQSSVTDSKPKEIAKGTTPPKVITPTPPKSPITPKPPVTPPQPSESPGESVSAFKPADGFTGRLVVVFSIGCALGLGGLQMRRVEDSMFPTSEEKQAAAKIGYIDFWHGFRHFLAAQGGFVLVAVATGAVVLIWDTASIHAFENANGLVFYKVGSAFLWMLAGMGLAGLGIMLLGAAGVNLMPTLDRKVQSTIASSAVVRFALRKIWHIILMGLIFGAIVSVSFVEPIRLWWDLWLKWSLGIGMVVACCWNGAKLISKEKEIKPLPITRSGQFRLLPFFNLPLLTTITLLATGCVMLLGQVHWLQLWWITPLIGLGITLALAALQTVPRLLRNWMNILFFPGIVALICDWLVWPDSTNQPFWIVLGILSGLFALGICLTEVKETESGWLLAPPPSRRQFQPVLKPDKSGLQVRWGSLLIIMTATLLIVASAAKWAWSGLPGAPWGIPN